MWVCRLTSLEHFPGTSLTFDLMQDRTEQFMILVMTHLPFHWSRKVTPDGPTETPFPPLPPLPPLQSENEGSDIWCPYHHIVPELWCILTHSCTMTSLAHNTSLFPPLHHDPNRDYITCTNRQDILMGMFRPGSKSTWNSLPVEMLLELCNRDNWQSSQFRWYSLL